MGAQYGRSFRISQRDFREFAVCEYPECEAFAFCGFVQASLAQGVDYQGHFGGTALAERIAGEDEGGEVDENEFAEVNYFGLRGNYS
jgi:hypothetical protein